MIDPATGKPYVFTGDPNANGAGGGLQAWNRIAAGGMDTYTHGMDGDVTQFHPFNYSPEFLQSIGYTGTNPYAWQGGAADGGSMGMDPAFQQYLDSKGYSLATSLDGGEADQWARGRAFDAQGNPVGSESRWRPDVNEDAFFAAMMLGGAFGGSMAAGVGAAGGAGGQAATAGGSGISADSLAYGSLENGASYGSGYGSTLTASAEPGFGGALGEGGAAYGGEAGALSYSNPAALDAAASGSGGGGFGGGGLFGGSGSIPTGFGATDLTAGELLAGGGGVAGLGGMGASGYGANNSLGGFDYSGAGGSGSSSLTDLAKKYLTDPKTGGMNGVASSLLGLGVGALGGGGGGSINTPNYQQAATAMGQSGRTNQTNPYGSLTYKQTGTDAQGNPTYSQDVSLNPQGQANLTSAQQAQETALGGWNDVLAKSGTDWSNIPGIYGDADSQAGLVQKAQDAMYSSQARYLDPQYKQQQDQLSSQLANQGVTMGSQAYTTAMDNFARQRDSAYGAARDSSINQGNAFAGQLFNQGLQAHNAGVSDWSTHLTGSGNAATTAGSNANSFNPTFAAPPASTNYLGAAALQGQGNLNQYNATVGNQNSTQNGLFNLGGSIISNPSWTDLIGSYFKANP